MEQPHYFVIGIDVGGTNTDAVIMEYPSKTIISDTKTFTTKDISTGVFNSIKKVLANKNQIKATDISAVMLGTTTFVNAVVQNSNELSKVTVVRLCWPATMSFPPFCNFPEKLKEKISQKIYFCKGGYEYNQETITDIDENELSKVADELIEMYKKEQLNILNVVISGIFSSLSNDQEERAGNILSQKFASSNINYSLTLSHKISQIGLLEREGASILNACLIPLAQRAIPGLKKALISLNLINSELFLTSNTGTIITSEQAQQYPIFTFTSGPVNSLRGASFLSNVQDAIICDIGGTTSDLAVIQNGFPRPCSTYVSVAGVRTNFRMPDTVSFGLGGGSLVKFTENNSLSIGPQSVGYKLKTEAISFGGNILTMTDVALAMGLAEIDETDSSNVNHVITEDQKQKVIKKVLNEIEFYVDQIKTNQQPMKLILVGGGSILIPNDAKLEGISEIIKPKYFDVANAVGAANIQVEGIVDTIVKLDPLKRKELLAEIEEEAKMRAIKNGAIEKTIIIQQFETIDLSYIPGNTTRVIIKAIGDLDISKINKCHSQAPPQSTEFKLSETIEPFIEEVCPVNEFQEIIIQEPKIVTVNGRKEWHLNEFDADCIAIGAGILGTGGGGSPYLGNLQLKFALRDGKIARVISPDDLRKEELVQIVAYYGAPLIFVEKVSGGEGCEYAMKAMEQLLKSQGKTINALSSAEIGGCNSIIPLLLGANNNLPVIDGDFMGRAFPELQMCTCFMLNAMKCTPIASSDEKNNTIIVSNTQFGSNIKAEQFLRSIVVQIGCMGGLAFNGMEKEQVEKSMIKYSISRCWRLGREIMSARKNKTDPLEAIEKEENGKLVFQGKIIDVSRKTELGFNKGVITLSGLNLFKGFFHFQLNKKLDQTLYIDFQNENLIARTNDKIIAVVPDLICLVDLEIFEPVCTEDLKYGLRVNCLIILCDPILKTPEVLKICGPRAFGYDIDYNKELISEMEKKRSITQEYL